MFRHLSKAIKLELIESLMERYNENFKRYNDDLARVWYDEDDLIRMKEENKRISKLINMLRESLREVK